ncbi:DNA gyrase subunit A [Patescibacteria group bacterium]
MPKKSKKNKPISKSNKPKKEVTTETSTTTEIARLETRSLVDEMQESYLDYAMSVIVSRALPDVRDGLKPVHRKILYAMWQLGLKSGAKFRKSATVVGEVLGKYHPHGDVAVYDSMVRMAQDFALRYPLVNGQGNFGSMDGDNPAAMRYTEAKLERIAEELLYDIEKDTVNFQPNYDGSHTEPTILPARLPNLLLTGTVGIAVGMATSIPPHNLNEVIDGILHLIEKPQSTVDDLMEFIKGPDFPTGGTIYNKDDIKQAYATGKGGVVLRGKAMIEEKAQGFQIIVTEIPYQVNKAALVEKIADLVRDKKLEGIRDLRDESDRTGVRIVIELRRDAYPKKVLNRLYTHTLLQDTFHFNMVALVDGIQPRILTLKTALEEYIKHRQEVVKRRTSYELEVAEKRAHILQGLKRALDQLDPVIKTIKKSKDRDQAKINLMKRFKFTETQAIAILEMKLQQLANLERKKITDELAEKLKLIKELKSILTSPKKILTIIKDELKEIKDKFGDERRTDINPNAIGKFTQEDLIPNEATIVMLTRDGYIKRVDPTSFKTQSRGGKGVIGLNTKEQDVVEEFFATTTHADLLFFTNSGKVFQLKAYDIPAATRTSRGQAIVNFLQLSPNESVTAALSLEEIKDEKFLAMVTKHGVTKKVALNDFTNVRRSGLIAIRLRKDDELEWVKPTDGNDDIVLVTTDGQSIRFSEKGLRTMGRNAAGVRGIRLKGGDEISGMDIVDKEDSKKIPLQLLIVSEKGHGKRTMLNAYKVQGRGGSGIKTLKVTAKTGKVVSAFVVNKDAENEDLIIISEKGQVIRMKLKGVSTLGRATQGVRLMKLDAASDKVANVTFV